MASLGRVIGKMATATAPIMLQKWRDDVDEAEAKRLREWKSGENQKSLAQDQAQFESRSAQRKGEFDVSSADASARTDILFANTETRKQEANKAIELLDMKIEDAGMSLEDKQDVRSLREELKNIDATDDAGRKNLVSRLSSYGVDVGSADFGFNVLKTGDFEEPDALVRYNKKTGAAGIVDLSASGTSRRGQDEHGFIVGEEYTDSSTGETKTYRGNNEWE